MKLSSEQLKAFDEQGYVFFPYCFSEEEIALLRTEPGAQFTYPSRIAGTISLLIAEEGDAEVAYA